ncbi:MAG: YqeG family HAD IIIA-type phosphatase, partial [Clostridiales bacterium]|nr:YqeG family HAD IIIA-type phosphatase [Clostridiales bacterium]
MLELLLPDEYVASVFDIDLEGLKKRGIDGLIIDIDNTLVRWGAKTADRRVVEWFARLEELGFKACLLSNNTKDRVVKF